MTIIGDRGPASGVSVPRASTIPHAIALAEAEALQHRGRTIRPAMPTR
jgi:hypothetical protein